MPGAHSSQHGPQASEARYPRCPANVPWGWDASWTLLSYGAAMLISYVLRLHADELASGRVVGEVEAVASGQRFLVRSVEQMIAFLMETSQAEEASVRAAQPLYGEA